MGRSKIVAVREAGDAPCTRDASRWLSPEIVYLSGAVGHADDLVGAAFRR
jgi:hypothetical protein